MEAGAESMVDHGLVRGAALTAARLRALGVNLHVQTVTSQELIKLVSYSHYQLLNH